MFALLLISLYGIAQAQKGEKSIAAGPLMSFPLANSNRGESNLKTGMGLETIGQYNFSNKSALLLKLTFSSWSYKEDVIVYGTKRLSLLTIQGGYQYQFGSSGFFINGLVGTDIELNDAFTTISFTLGAGKRFIINDTYFIDAGIDLVGGDADARVNIKALFSLFRWPKKK